MILISFLASIMYLYAQESPFSIGLKGGVNLSNVSIDTDGYDEMKRYAVPGYVIGLTGEYSFNRNFFLASEFLFLSKGVKLKGIDQWIHKGETRWKKTVHMHYLQVPVLATFKMEVLFADDGQLVFQAGPYIAYGIGGKIKTDNRYVYISKPNDSEKSSTFGKDGFDRLDYGLTFRLGMEFKRYTIAVNLDGGLRDINDTKHDYNLAGRGGKNISGYLTFGYSF